MRHIYTLYFELKIDQRFPNVKKTPLYQKGVSAWSAKDWGVQFDGVAGQTRASAHLKIS
jgi:hypothetical protein